MKVSPSTIFYLQGRTVIDCKVREFLFKFEIGAIFDHLGHEPQGYIFHKKRAESMTLPSLSFSD